MVAAVGSAHARGAVTTFTTGVLRFPSRVLRPRCICGQCYHPRGAGGLVQMDECLHVVSAGLARIRRPPWSSRTLLRVTWQPALSPSPQVWFASSVCHVWGSVCSLVGCPAARRQAFCPQ